MISRRCSFREGQVIGRRVRARRLRVARRFSKMMGLNKICLHLVWLSGLWLALAMPLGAQQGNNSRGNDPSQPALSRGEQEAEEQVSLSADRIIELLRQEPGLLLQVKKLLVREAFAQGRLLEPKDLTDEALFRLLQEDEGVRVLATREIEDRAYVRAKPSQGEIAREGEWSTRRDLRPALSLAGAGVSGDQERAYWTKHEEELHRSGAPGSSPQPPGYPQPPLGPRAPQYAVPENPARVLERTDLEQDLEPGGSEWEGAGGTSENRGVMQAELPGLVNGDARPTGPPRDSLGMERAGNGVAETGEERPVSFAPGTISAPGQSSVAARELSVEAAERSREARLAYSQPRPRPIAELDLGEDRPRVYHRPNPYANIPSLYDLYTQVSGQPPRLERFGLEVFRAGTDTLNHFPMDLPAGPDYVLGPGDGLSIDLWGSVPQRLQRTVDPEGRVALPEVGAVEISGHNLGEVQHLVQAALRSQFRDIQADVSLARIRTVRVYVVGDVVSPGGYDISSLSTPLNALYAAGGPTARGSLRRLRHYRGRQLLDEIDGYELLLHGVHDEPSRMQSGDTLLIPPAGPEVTVEGMVRRPAIYELAEEKSLAQVLELAGGVLPSGALRHVDVERLVAHEKLTMLRLDLPEGSDPQTVDKSLEEFQVQDGDRVKISPIVPYADRTVYLDGHVLRPGKYPYREGMKVTDLLHSYRDLLPEPSRGHAEIIRLEPPDYTPVVLTFNLGEAMEGEAQSKGQNQGQNGDQNKDQNNDQNLVLQPFDTLRIFARYDFEDPPVITITGEVRDPGDHVTNGATHLRDAVYLAGGTTPNAELNDAQVFRRTSGNQFQVMNANLSRALAGEPKDNILLAPRDRVFIHRSPAKADPPTVNIQGQVERPGKYPLGQDMTAADLVRVAGGLKRGAYAHTADLTRYVVESGKKVAGEHMEIPLAAALAGQRDTDVRLHDGDVLTIGELAGWNDVGATIRVMGEVQHPGVYGISEGERLSSILLRAGGLRSDAYPYGAIFERAQVREMEERNRSELLQQIEREGTQLKAAPQGDEEQKSVKQAAMSQWQTALERLQNTPPSGRLVIHISSDLKRWVNTPADVAVRAGDVFFVPKRPGIVMVNGSVYNPTAVTYKPGKNAGWYLSQAGGPNNVANKKAIFVIHADGSVAGGSGGLFKGGVESGVLRPGDMVVVPEKGFSANSRWKNTLQAAQLAYAVGIALQVGRSF